MKIGFIGLGNVGWGLEEYLEIKTITGWK